MIDTNDAPSMSSAVFYIDESQLDGVLQGLLPIGTMNAYDPDVASADPTWSTLTYSIPTNAYNNSAALFAVSRTNGTVYLASRLKYVYNDGSRYITGVKARGQWNAIVSVCDGGLPPLCANASMSLIVVANYSAPLQPAVLAYNPSNRFQTQGGELIT